MAMISRKVRPWKMREFHGPTPHSIAIVAKPRRKDNPIDKIIQDGRKQDELEREKKELDYINQRQVLRNEWESYSEKKTKQSILKRQVGGLMKYEEFDVNDRREKLRDILEKEDQSYIDEIASKEETLLERQAKMRERARQLKERRETERLEFVQKKYDQQFRDQCEEVRSTISKRRQDEACVHRVEQLRIKDEMNKQAKAVDKLYDELWMKDMQEKAAKEERDLIEQKARCRDVLVGQQKQMAALEEQKERDKLLKEDEQRLLKEQKALMDLEEQRQREYKAQKERETRRAFDSAVIMKNRIQERLRQEDLAFDLNNLEKLLQETHDEEAWNRMRKVELRDEDFRYREYLKNMLEVEKQKEQELNDIIQTDVEKIEKKKLDKYLAEQEKRRKLLSDILAIRDEQIRQRLLENARLQEEEKEERRANERLIAEIQRKMQLEKEMQFQNKLKYRSDLNNQMAYSNRLLEEERQRLADEYEAGKSAEAEYQKKILDVLNGPEVCRIHPTSEAILERHAKMLEPVL